jgi:hypothetical protein
VPNKFILKLDSLIIPYSHGVVSGSCCNQSKIVAVSTTDNVLLVAVLLASKYILSGVPVFFDLVRMYLDHSVPSAGYDVIVIFSIGNE